MQAIYVRFINTWNTLPLGHMKTVYHSIFNTLNGLIEEAKAPNAPEIAVSDTATRVFDASEMERLMHSFSDVPLKMVTGVDVVDVPKARKCEDSNVDHDGNETDVDEIEEGADKNEKEVAEEEEVREEKGPAEDEEEEYLSSIG